MGTGDESGTWGDLTNTNLGTLLEQSIVGYTTQTITDGSDTVLTMPNGTSATARNYVLELTGALTANRNLIVPAIEKPYTIYNNTSGGFSVAVKVSGQTGVTVANGKKAIVYNNGTDVIEVVNAPVTETGTQTLTNKTLTSPTITGGTINNAVIGGTTPAAGTFSAATVYNATSAAATVQGDATTNIIAQRSSADAVQANLVVRKTRGTVASPSAVQSSDVAGNLSYQVFGGTNNRSIADIVGVVKTYTSDTNISGYLAFLTNGGSTSGTERMRITETGSVIIGNGDTSATPSNGVLEATDGSGTDIAGASLTIQGGRGTGTGAGGSVIISTAAAGGTTGTSLNSATERFRVGPAGQFGIGGANYGTSGQVLVSAGASAAPAWTTLSVVPTTDVQTFTTAGAGTWTKPSGSYSSYKVQIWGAGGSGARGNSNEPGGGGGGGAYLEISGPLSELDATEDVVVGAGGASRTSSGTDGAAGGSSSFTIGATTYTVYGGGGGGVDGTTNNGGGGGGGSIFAVGGSTSTITAGTAGGPDAGAGGAGGAAAAGGAGSPGTTGGGGGGGSSSGASDTNGAGGASIFGGGGGGAAAVDSNPGPGAGGTSIFGGAGGAGSYDSNAATAGAVPGGGGGGSEQGNSGAGGNGKVIVTVW
jgi:hypothetical protein